MLTSENAMVLFKRNAESEPIMGLVHSLIGDKVTLHFLDSQILCMEEITMSQITEVVVSM